MTSFPSNARPVSETSPGLAFGRNTSWRWMQGNGPALSAEESAAIRQLVAEGAALPTQHGPHGELDVRYAFPSAEDRYQAPLTEAEVLRLRATVGANGTGVRRDSVPLVEGASASSQLNASPLSAEYARTGSSSSTDRRGSAPLPPRPLLQPPRILSSVLDRPPLVPPNSIQSPKVGSMWTRVPGCDVSPTAVLPTPLPDGSFAPTRANTASTAAPYRNASSGYFAQPPSRIVSVVSEYSTSSNPSRYMSETTSPLHGGSLQSRLIPSAGPPSFPEGGFVPSPGPDSNFSGGQWLGSSGAEVLMRPSSLVAHQPPSTQAPRASVEVPGSAPVEHVFSSFGYPSTPRVSRGASSLPHDVLPSPANSRARVSRTYASELVGHRRKKSEG
eukprot:GGOE01020266.1.p1 GENE.GGOE01020266.1~~GGOE01020266.1.p1  ORF type:complete len:447 (-),score=57.43 GGOE01020266.1:212-1372(-)